VATNKQGFLPSNIVQPLWGTIKNKPAPFADGQISWSELQGIPAGFADGVDNKGVTGVTVVTNAEADTIGASTTRQFLLYCPAGQATGGGFALLESTTRVLGAAAYGNYYYLVLQNSVATPDPFNYYVTCLTTDGGTSVASRLTRAARDARPGK